MAKKSIKSFFKDFAKDISFSPNFSYGIIGRAILVNTFCTYVEDPRNLPETEDQEILRQRELNLKIIKGREIYILQDNQSSPKTKITTFGETIGFRILNVFNWPYFLLYGARFLVSKSIDKLVTDTMHPRSTPLPVGILKGILGLIFPIPLYVVVEFAAFLVGKVADKVVNVGGFVINKIFSAIKSKLKPKVKKEIELTENVGTVKEKHPLLEKLNQTVETMVNNPVPSALTVAGGLIGLVLGGPAVGAMGMKAGTTASVITKLVTGATAGVATGIQMFKNPKPPVDKQGAPINHQDGQAVKVHHQKENKLVGVKAYHFNEQVKDETLKGYHYSDKEETQETKGYHYSEKKEVNGFHYKDKKGA